MNVITKFEYSHISEKDFIDRDDYIKAKEYLKLLNEKYNIGFSFTENGIEIGQYVGIIEYDKDKYIEILPKIYNKENISDYEVAECRMILTKW